jgi:hypothetical protein
MVQSAVYTGHTVNDDQISFRSVAISRRSLKEQYSIGLRDV